MFENPRRGRQARNFTTKVPKILDVKSSSEQIFSENCHRVPLFDDTRDQTWDLTQGCALTICPILHQKINETLI